ncbi:zinc transporter [Thalictrum thalictroides]|uniref:Zinc transporter n=1 Tax=Thalictrum thalictroides TaxID=46969 RepID=A0A7J6X314_THATH|nr:zinc transporter [Thalictrum thalictroides]
MKLQFPFWTYLSAVLFGVVLIFYIDNIAEERLHVVFSSPRHLMIAGGSIIVMEIVYKMDFSLPGFLICAIILGFGIYEATSIERISKGHEPANDGTLENQNHTLPIRT